MHGYIYIILLNLWCLWYRSKYIYLYISFSARKNFFFNCTLGSGVHVQIIQDCCIGTYMGRWFAASIPPSPISGISPLVIPPKPPTPHCPSPIAPAKDPSVWCSHPCVYVFSLFYEWEHAVFDFLFLYQFAENDDFQIHSCPYKGRKFIVFYGCIVFHVVYVPHFLCPVYHWWAFGLVPGLCYCK